MSALQQALLMVGATSAGDPFSANVVFLSHFDGTNGSTSYVDETGRHTFTNTAGAALSTAQFKFGTASLKGDGATAAVTLSSDADFTFGTGDWTIECWVRPDAGDASSVASLVDFRPAGVNGDYPTLRLGGSANVIYETNNIPRIASATSSLAATTWQHVALARVGTNTRLFINGVQQSSAFFDTVSYVIGTPRLLHNSGGSTAMSGYLDDVRITKGVGRYASAFTPPTAAFPYP